ARRTEEYVKIALEGVGKLRAKMQQEGGVDFLTRLNIDTTDTQQQQQQQQQQGQQQQEKREDKYDGGAPDGYPGGGISNNNPYAGKRGKIQGGGPLIDGEERTVSPL
ncbi:hypothetical protein, conserved, partial [Eimeria maxima]